MDWLPVMTLPDGTAIEVPVPSPEDTGTQGDVHAYRVRGPSGTTTFATLDEAADHVMHLPDQAWQNS
jgi:hypothetical protein